MFFRCLDERHPANRGKEVEKYKHVIRDLYIRMDQLLERVLAKTDDKTVLLVMSDHGFTQFKRGVNINTWLFHNGYLALKPGKDTSGDWFQDVEWEQTKAFSLGLTGIFINRKGREAHGIVEEGKELEDLKRELITKLTGLVDHEAQEVSIQEVVDTARLLTGPYIYDAPDLLLGYNAGYRNSWDCAAGRVSKSVFEDNTKSWSGDHCVDPKIVPGVLVANRKINTSLPDIKDLAPTVLNLFEVEIPSFMKGRPLIKTADEEELPRSLPEEKWITAGQRGKAA
jgi:predicted AlkP superfamily phosphohydrolase/phosphomutase